MIPPSSDTAQPAASKPVELSGPELDQLRNAAGWARFVAIVGFVSTGILGVAFVTIVFLAEKRVPGAVTVNARLIPGALALITLGAGSVLLWAHGRNVVSFFDQGEPALARAFRSLRLLVKVLVAYEALMLVIDLVSMLGKR